MIKKRNTNSDGLINCLRQRQDKFVINPNIYALKFCSIYKMLWHPDSFVYRDSIIGAVGRRSGASFFARHLDYFIVTRISQPLPGLGTITQLHRDPKPCTVTFFWLKYRDLLGAWVGYHNLPLLPGR
jgi:hypothetical protein